MVQCSHALSSTETPSGEAGIVACQVCGFWFAFCGGEMIHGVVRAPAADVEQQNEFGDVLELLARRHETEHAGLELLGLVSGYRRALRRMGQ